jgi:HD-like signal output (HDOD) protein
MTHRSERNLLVVGAAGCLETLAQQRLAEGSQAWRIARARDAAGAWSLLEARPFDAVAVELNLAGRGGDTLLAELDSLEPRPARMVVTPAAHYDDASVAAIATLPAGAPAELFEAMAERSLALHRLFESAELNALVAQLDDLPAMPATYLKLREASSSPDTGMKDLADIIESDPVLSAKALQLVNSAFFGLRQRVSTIHRAVTFLGASVLKALALAATTFSVFERAPVSGFSLDGIQNYSIRVARLAQRLLDDRVAADEAFTAALIQDIGKIMFAFHFGRPYTELAQQAATEGLPLEDLECERFGASHHEVGALLLRRWGIPFSIVESVAFHHRPSTVRSGPRAVLAAAHAADALLGIVTCGDPEDRLDVAFLESVGLADRLPEWRQLATQY